MPEPQLSIRSAKAKNLAHQIARRERRTITQVVEMALENYEQKVPAKPLESAESFWTNFSKDLYAEGDSDIDLEALIRSHRQPQRPIEF